MPANIIKKRLYINMVLLGSALLIAAWLWFNPTEDPEAIKTVSSLDKNDIQTIRIEVGSKPALEFKKQGAGWRIKQPLEIAASNFRVNTVLNLLSMHAQSRYDAADLDMAEFGLDSAKAVVYFDEHAFQFGGIDPISKKRYVLYDKTLLLVDDTIFPLVSSRLGGFVNNRLLPEGAQPLEFRLQNFSLSKVEKGGWKITPEDESLSADSLQNWVDGWQYAQAIYVDHQVAGVNKAGHKIIIQLQDATTVLFLVEKSSGDNVLYRPDVGLKYILSEESLNALTSLPKTDSVEIE